MQTGTLSLDSPKQNITSVISGVLLISGTCVGAGMLALPVVTGMAGFLPAMVVNTLCWLFMLATGLLLVEATLWMDDGANILSMAQRFLGPVGKIISGGTFLFLYYCLLVAYLAGGTPLLAGALGLPLEGLGGYLLFASLFGGIVFLGTRVVDRMNWLLMMSLILSYVLLISVGSTEVQTGLLTRSNWLVSLGTFPVLFSAYGYHNVIPSTVSYLKRNAQLIRAAVIIGTAIPFIVYSLWQWMVIGSIPTNDLTTGAASGAPITVALQAVTGNPWVSFLGGYFGFFALVTSFLGVSLSMVDFLADGLSIDRTGIKRLGLCLAVFIPPALFAAANPDIFVSALGIAGGIGEALLNGLLPIAMVWIGRYRMGLGGTPWLFGGRIVLSTLAIIALAIMAFEIGILIL